MEKRTCKCGRDYYDVYERGQCVKCFQENKTYILPQNISGETSKPDDCENCGA